MPSLENIHLFLELNGLREDRTLSRQFVSKVFAYCREEDEDAYNELKNIKSCICLADPAMDPSA